ncbi:MAG: proline--tRNA ligase [Alphaproteobacteria bacterium CG_4_10_14_0_2_um_filter_63_37]|nr:MAG: proline--tRNA ligase [Proteobacteria bacterium CG1_02_64_396]PJA26043.1 MAG: proline--tRNA ligase [Alphaproteobacteria bacterium CG_4_10_14_0_2_um_filter_63_37]
MQLSTLLVPTLKETPAQAELASHRLMLRAGLIRQVTSGLYTYLPLGLKALRRIEQVVREEMDGIGAQEVLMPMVQPAELWQSSGRWEQYGKELLRFKDRHDREMALGPTHEEVVTDLVASQVRSYKQLPLVLYQIQTKFRDEIRPRFGVMRAREFVMKDAYSFHATSEDVAATYRAMYDAYGRIFTRLGLRFRAVEADTGSIGGSASHEFQVLAEAGEDLLAVCDACDYAANVEQAVGRPRVVAPLAGEGVQKVPTPGKSSIEDVAAMLGVDPAQTVKALVLQGDDGKVRLVFVRGDHQLNEIKLGKATGVDDWIMVDGERVAELTGQPAGFIGPQGLKGGIEVWVDEAAAALPRFAAGAGEVDHHVRGLSWRDEGIAPHHVADLRQVAQNDGCPRCRGELNLVRGIEVGHVFHLGNKYSAAMGATFLDGSGEAQVMEMGCYGIGVSRLIAAVIEQHHDEDGIVWPVGVAPYRLHVVVLDGEDPEVAAAWASLEGQLQHAGIEPLVDDRDLRPGIKFKEADLLGMPYRWVLGKRGIGKGIVEVAHRDAKLKEEVKLEEAVTHLAALLAPQNEEP